jgi:hypothetical protein
MSFYSRSFYRNAANSWTGWGGMYSLLLVSVICFFLMVSAQMAIHKTVNTRFFPVIDQIPPIQIIEGVVSINETIPYTIEDPFTKKPAVVIDTRDQPSENIGDPYLYIGKNSMAYRTNPAQYQTYPLNWAKKVQLDRKLFKQWAVLFDRWTLFSFFPFVVVGIWVIFVPLVFCLAFITFFLAACLGRLMNYVTSMRLTMFAITTFCLIDTAQDFFKKEIPYPYIWMPSVIIFYILLAIFSLERQQKNSNLSKVLPIDKEKHDQLS